MSFWQKLQKPFMVLAPMEDVTDFVFREIIATKLPRPDVFFTEFTSSDGITSKGYKNTVHRLKFGDNQRPIVAQIWGTDAKNMYQATKIVSEMGFDGVDVNMGCPDKNVMKKGAGAAMCLDHALAGEIIDAVKKASNGMAVSVKTRIGYNEIITNEWISFLLEQKIDALTIHGRTAKQMSFGVANWDEIYRGVEIKNRIAPDTIIIGNGDITGYKNTIGVHEKYKVDGTMIGRGIFRNPWVFDRSEDPLEHPKEEYLDLLLHHMRLYTETWGQEKNFHIMKKFFKMYVNNFKGAAKLRERLMSCRNASEVEALIDTA